PPRSSLFRGGPYGRQAPIPSPASVHHFLPSQTPAGAHGDESPRRWYRRPRGAHWVAVPPDCDPEPVRRFDTFTADLETLADWLTACGVDTVARAPRGVSCIPLYELLERRGFKVFLVDARAVAKVNGRPKSDIHDCH